MSNKFWRYFWPLRGKCPRILGGSPENTAKIYLTCMDDLPRCVVMTWWLKETMSCEESQGLGRKIVPESEIPLGSAASTRSKRQSTLQGPGRGQGARTSEAGGRSELADYAWPQRIRRGGHRPMRLGPGEQRTVH